MNEFFKNLDLKKYNILKIIGFSILALFAIVFIFDVVGTVFNTAQSGVNTYSVESAPSYDYAANYDEGSAKLADEGSYGLSLRNVATSPSIAPSPRYNGTTGDDAEAYEVTEYNASIEARDLDATCKVITDLKSREDVIFETASAYEHACNYTFKVRRDAAETILDIVKGLEPKELSESTYTIKKLVEDFTSQTEILQKKLASIDDTMRKAVGAYDSVTALATSVKDVESLAKIIDSKITIIERLTQSRIDINAQLERLARSKAEQLDRLEYTYFHVNIFENKFVDAQSLKDSWKAAVQEFVRDANTITQDITINLVSFLLFALEYALYILVIAFIAKYAWKKIKSFWNK